MTGKMKLITFSTAAIAKIRAGTKTETRRRVRRPVWWEGHRIGYKVYPDGPGTIGYYAELLCARDGGRQRRNPYGEPGDLLRPRGTRLTLRIEHVEIAGELYMDPDKTGPYTPLELRPWVVAFRLVRRRRTVR